MTQRYDVLGFGLIMLAVALFAVTGTADDLFTDKSWLFRYQSFLGSLIGAAGTIFAGWFAFRRQVSHAAQQLAQSETAARLAAIKKREKNMRVYEELRALANRSKDLSPEDKVSWSSEVERCLRDAGHLGEAELFRTHPDHVFKVRMILGRMAKLAEAGSEPLTRPAGRSIRPS